jgi:glycerol transport system ATP-binding protein
VGTPEDLFERPEHTFVGYFIGSPGMNIASCELKGDRIVVEGAEIELDYTYPEQKSTDKIEVGIRPEHLNLAPPDTPGGFPVTITKIDDIGRYKIVRVTLKNKDFNVVMHELSAVTGDKATLHFDTSHTHIYVNDHLISGAAK